MTILIYVFLGSLFSIYYILHRYRHLAYQKDVVGKNQIGAIVDQFKNGAQSVKSKASYKLYLLTHKFLKNLIAWLHGFVRKIEGRINKIVNQVKGRGIANRQKGAASIYFKTIAEHKQASADLDRKAK